MDESFKQYLINELYTDNEDNSILYLNYIDLDHRDYLLDRLMEQHKTTKLTFEGLHGLFCTGFDDKRHRIHLIVDHVEFGSDWKFNFIPYNKPAHSFPECLRSKLIFKPKVEDS